MRTLQILALTLISMMSFSCVKHQFLSIENASLQKHKTGYAQEGKEIDVLYHFDQQTANLNIEIVNKSDKNMIVDWSRSGMVVNGKKVNFYISTQQSKLSIQETGVSGIWGFLNMSSGQIEGSTSTLQNAAFIPANSRMIFLQTNMSSCYDPAKNAIQLKKTKVKLYDGTKVATKKADYTTENTPLKFRCILSLYRDGEPTNIQTLDQEFYVSQVIECIDKATINNMDKKNNEHIDLQEHNKVRLVRSTETGRTLAGIGAVSVGAILLVGSLVESSDSR